MLFKPASAGKVALLLALFSALPVFGQSDAEKYYQWTLDEFHRTQVTFQTNGQIASNCWIFARACFNLAEDATNSEQRADIAKYGIAACHQLLARDPNSAAGHYYLGMDEGEYADAEAPSLTSYRLVHEMENEFLTAAKLDKNMDYGGAARCLGLLYRDAPGWPLSLGSRAKAHEWLVRAAVINPGYPENYLNLAEGDLRWHEGKEAEAALKKLDAIWPAAQTNLTGVGWIKNWSDWTSQRAAAKALLQKDFKHVSGP
ncbi:MAG TPA: hypothetical protein VK742_10365 [Candidatus Sulfotelmatobacter sp.]|jgi:hypothetical protein|nr:hypothetical protein [Candidatus Sulfotelmatobacter sp.]